MELFKAKIQDLYKTGDWRTILKTLEHEDKWFPHVLWIRPSEENIRFIANIVNESGSSGLVSIGCGTGLLEWLIQSATGLNVMGLEVDKDYWISYSQRNGQNYMPHIYPTDSEFIHCSTSKHNVLLFCYFNYRKSFNDYIRNYKGNCVIIIGPGTGRGTHTDPEPFNPQFSYGNWVLTSFQEIRDTKDFIAVYKCDDS